MTQAVQGKFNVLRPLLDERTRCLWAAAEARAIGRGGIPWVAKTTGMSCATIRADLREQHASSPQESRAGIAQVGTLGGGRQAPADRDPGLVRALEVLLDRFPRATLRVRCSGRAAARRAGRSSWDLQDIGSASAR